MRLRHSLVLTAALMLTVALAVPAAAQGQAEDDTNVTITPGLLYIDGGQIAEFGTHALTGVAFDLPAAVEPVEVGDLRGSGEGYTVTVQATQFAQAQNTRTLPAGSLALERFASVAGRDTDSANPGLTAGDTPTVDVNGAVVLASAAEGAGMGIFDFAQAADAASLTIPADAYAGTYESTLTYTVATGPFDGTLGAGLRWS